jgi:DNA end-binding protein Ku
MEWQHFDGRIAVAIAVWTGTLGFGLVSIPVRLYPATQPKDVRFHLVDPESGRRIRYRRVVETDDGALPPAARGGDGAKEEDRSHDAGSEGMLGRSEHELTFDDLARGYEVEPGRMVVLPREEIERVRPTRSRTIDVEEFVELARIDPVFFEKSYYVAPQAGAEQPYVLLLRAMEREGLVGIARFVLRTKPHLVAIRPMEAVLGLETMYFADEVRSTSEVVPHLSSDPVPKKHLALAQQLIEAMRTDWEPTRYADDYRNELLRLISDRDTEPSSADEAPPPGTPRVQELMDALKKSLEAAKAEHRMGGKTPKRRPAS